MSPTPRVQFGTFDFCPATGELRRDDVPVRLQAQPAQVLAILVEHAGDVVTREMLQQAVWGNDTFVDFERGLNFCVAQIRAALRDSAESPIYIRTVPKQGYKFIAPVSRQGRVETAAPPAPIRGRSWHNSWAAVLVIAPAILMLLSIRLFMAHRATQPVIRIAVARFDNQTGNPELDRFADGLGDAVVAELTAWGGDRVGVIGNAAILRQPRESRDLEAIGSSLNVKYVVLGQVQGSPPHVRVLGHLIRLPEQTHMKVSASECDIGDAKCTQPELARRMIVDFSSRLAASSKPASN